MVPGSDYPLWLNDEELRFRALELAHINCRYNTKAATVIARANAYLKYIKGAPEKAKLYTATKDGENTGFIFTLDE